jgi:ribosomal protein L24E
MSANQKCYYCGSSFTPGSSLHGTYFGVQESKFGVVHPVCSKKCKNEFKNHKVNKEKPSGCFGSVIFITIIALTGISCF